MRFPCDMVDMDMVNVDMVDVDMVDVDMVNVDKVDVDIVGVDMVEVDMVDVITRTTITRTTTKRTTTMMTTTINTIAKTMVTDPGNGNWVRHAKCPWSSFQYHLNGRPMAQHYRQRLPARQEVARLVSEQWVALGSPW